MFRVKFYSSEPSINLQEEITRYQFVLQLKHDILKGILPVSYETIIELSAQALQGTHRYLIAEYRSHKTRFTLTLNNESILFFINSGVR